MTREGNELPNSIFSFSQRYSITGFSLWKQTSFSILTNFSFFFFSLVPTSPYPPEMMLCRYMFWHKSHQLFFSFRSLTDCEELCRFQQFLMRKLSYCFANSQNFLLLLGGGKRIHCDVLSSLRKQVCLYREEEIKKKQIIEKLFLNSLFHSFSLAFAAFIVFSNIELFYCQKKFVLHLGYWFLFQLISNCYGRERKNNLERCYTVDTTAAHGKDAVSTGKKLGQSKSVVAFSCSSKCFPAISIALLLILFDTELFEGCKESKARKNVWRAWRKFNISAEKKTETNSASTTTQIEITTETVRKLTLACFHSWKAMSMRWRQKKKFEITSRKINRR